MSFHCLHHVRSLEFAIQRQARYIQGIDGEMVMMQALIVPGWARTVIPPVDPFQVRVAGKELGVVVDSTDTDAGTAGLFATYRDATGVFTFSDTGNIRRNID